MAEQDPWAVTRDDGPARTPPWPAHPLYRDAERFRAIVETAHEGIWFIDLDARSLFVNERMAALLGRRPDEILGRMVTEFCFPEDLPAAGERIRSNFAGRFEQFDFRFRRRDGTALHVLAATSPVCDRDGTVVGALGMFSDLTGRRQAEAELRRLNETLEQRVEERTRALRDANRRLEAEIEERRQAETLLRRERRFSEMVIESAADGIVAIDREFRHTVWNAALEKMTGLSRDHVLGRTVTEVFPQMAGTDVEAAWRSALGGRTVAVNERRFRVDETGRSGVYDGNFTPLLGSDGRIIGAIAFLRDMTERRAMEEALRQSQKLEAIGQLTGGVAHDFNNLLSAILGNLELIATRTRSKLVAAWVKSATRAAERGARLTQELLAFSRKQRLDAKPVDLNALVTGMGDLLARTIGVVVRIERHLAPDLWPVLVDPTQLELVVLNLAINARDAMPEGGVLTIETANLAAGAPRPGDLAPGDYVMLAVRDTGEGMSEDVKARAFEPFFTTKEKDKGTGLGLSMVYGVAKQTGGTATIESRAGEGTILRLYLPRAAADSAREDRAAPAAAQPTSGGATILVVEDDEDVRSITVTFLEGRGHRVRAAEDGRRALEILGGPDSIDVMVADYAMPGMNGVDLVASARTRRPQLGIVFTTGYAAALARPPAGARVIAKPYRLSELGAAIDATLADAAPQRLQAVE
jgi:PAS domain S-box-containing protein